ncbi:pre-mRNA 3'-end processing factor CF II [Suhomyces tanzawaensis NRRL Y-17324]|uniref:Protein CFT1 n=1 Tax=Suhomyces tanzawaensis NRRL Y-17324 TaxID=984487 RepID=A0A1E4SMI2_9ASCO|nr:pre-mRNA 3'-end processing factor CF II [Suhomyces tanzawaensis NRRL Y-17324]ODV80617.1 pre-mRNA 3'-end processing factor CF II [Suhomyces tanzawaensis NRRL Y-17324]
MDAYHEFIEPTRVSHCVGANFISPSVKHLIVGKATLLQVFEVITLKLAKPGQPQHHLKLVEQYKLHGLITDLKPLRTIENPELDYLMVATKFAKFSIIKWDHYNHTISTVSLHFYENLIQNSTYEKLSRTLLLLEPTFNSISCVRFKNLLTFLPFETLDDDEDDDDDDDADADSPNREKVPDQLFDSSFLVDAQNLESSIGNIVDLQFLHHFREPTMGVLSLKSNTWAGILPKVKDNIQFMVLTLDVISKTAVSVFKVENLPYDIDRIIPLKAPLNGSLLVGCNELIHVDNGGIVRRIAVNAFTSAITASSKSYADQTDLNLKLEGSSFVQIPQDHRLLMIMERGGFYYVNFEVDGKAIKSFVIEPIDKSAYQNIEAAFVTETAILDNNLMFIGSANGSSPLISWDYQESHKTREEQVEINKEEDMDDDEDLYNEEEEDGGNKKVVITNSMIEYTKHDELVNNGPISNFTLGYYNTEKYKSKLRNPNFDEVSIISNGGTHEQGKLNIITPSIHPTISSSLSFSQINRMWTINKKYLITSDDVNSKSDIFQFEKSFARLSSDDFISDQSTIAMHELNNGKFILQITSKAIRLYDSSFKLLLAIDEIKDDEIVNTTLKDEFLMLFLSRGDVKIFAINTYNETYTTLEIPKILNDTIITSGYITNSTLLNAVLKDVNLLLNKGVKRKHSSASKLEDATDPKSAPVSDIKTKTFILVTGDNRIVAFNRFHNQRCYQLNDVSIFTDQLTLGFFDPNSSDPDPFIKQVMLNELGDEKHKEEYLTILTIGGQVLMYKLFHDGENYRFVKEKDLALTGASMTAYSIGTAIERRMAYFPNLNGYTGIFVTGVTPFLILKPTHSIPRIFKFTKISVVSVAPYDDSKVQNGLIFLDNDKNARIGNLPLDFNYENTWPIKQIHIGELIKSITYHESSNAYVLSTFTEIPYDCLDEENNPIVGIDKTKPGALSYKGSIKLISPINWSVIDSVELKDNEIGMTIKSMALDVGSSVKKFKNKKEFIVIGTGKYRMEDLSSNGSFLILEIIDIIPEPGRPETNHKFKEVFKEDTRGAVTSVCEVSGRFLVSQGQKVIVRDLQDDGVVPVAFLDTSVYVTESKSFGNLLILGDSLKSIWLVGFDAEPFRMIMLGKDLQSLDVNCADFIVKDEDIYVLIADNNNILHLVQYDPEDPSSLNGQRLINKASFAVNSSVTCMRSLPKVEETYDYEQGKKGVRLTGDFQSIASTIDGSFINVFPLSEASYRRLYIIQQQLIDKEYHYCGLNPRLNRFGGLSVTMNDINTKPILDYDVIRGYAKLNIDRRNYLASKVGSKQGMYEIWKDLIECEIVLRNL